MKRMVVVLVFLLGGLSVVEAEPLDETSAVQAAEQFVSRNGYTDVQASADKLTFEFLEQSKDPEAVLKARHDTLEAKAYGIVHQRKGAAGWTVVFRYKHQPSSTTGRAVTMNQDGANIRMEHVDFILSMVDKILEKFSAEGDPLVFSLARQELQRGESLLAKHEYKATIDAYSSGIAKLGDRYTSPGLNDDSGMKRSLAESEQAKGNLETAANLFHNVLESRIRAYQTLHQAKRE